MAGWLGLGVGVGVGVDGCVGGWSDVCGVCGEERKCVVDGWVLWVGGWKGRSVVCVCERREECGGGGGAERWVGLGWWRDGVERVGEGGRMEVGGSGSGVWVELVVVVVGVCVCGEEEEGR